LVEIVMGIAHSGSGMRAAIGGVFLGLALAAADAQASFHTWRIAELYSDATGVVQFVELHEASNADFQDRFAGILLTSQQGSTTRTYTFPTNLPSSSTSNKRLLIATPAFAALGIVTPDYVVSAPFLFVGGGMLDFASVDSVTYSALPTDGVRSLDRSGSAVINSPTNFSGQTGSIAAPSAPPQIIPTLNWAGLLLLASALFALHAIHSRRGA
jgi:hypothetical protein